MDKGGDRKGIRRGVTSGITERDTRRRRPTKLVRRMEDQHSLEYRIKTENPIKINMYIDNYIRKYRNMESDSSRVRIMLRIKRHCPK